MGTPQGGILSPLLANIMLSAIEERYERWIRPQVNSRGKRIANPKRAGKGNRQNDRQKGRPVFYPIRYADDFIVLVSGTEEDALQEKENLAAFLRESLKLSLSEEKTLVTPVTKGFLFLGHWIRLRWDDRYGGYWPSSFDTLLRDGVVDGLTESLSSLWSRSPCIGITCGGLDILTTLMQLESRVRKERRSCHGEANAKTDARFGEGAPAFVSTPSAAGP